MGADASALVADALVLLGLVVSTLGVIGLFRMPDVYTQLHSASKAVFLGVIAFLAASLAAGDAAVTSRALLIAAFLVLTTPVGAHAIALAAWHRREAMRTPGSIDESGREPPSQPEQPSRDDDADRESIRGGRPDADP